MRHPVQGRPAPVRAGIAVLVFLGLSAIMGGIGLIAGVPGLAPPHQWLEPIPLIRSWLVPGLVLLTVFGAGSLVTAYGLLRRPRWAIRARLERYTHHHWSWTGMLALGAGQLGWIAVELAYLPRSFLQAVFAGVGVALIALALHPATRRYLYLPSPRSPGSLRSGWSRAGGSRPTR